MEAFDLGQHLCPCVGHARAAEEQVLELFEAGQLFQARVSHRSVAELQRVELSKPGQVLQSGIADPGVEQVHASEVFEAGHLLQVGVRQLASSQHDRHDWLARSKLITGEPASETYDNRQRPGLVPGRAGTGPAPEHSQQEPGR